MSTLFFESLILIGLLIGLVDSVIIPGGPTALGTEYIAKMPPRNSGDYKNFAFYTKDGWIHQMNLNDPTDITTAVFVDDGSVSPDTFDMVVPSSYYCLIGIQNTGTFKISIYWFDGTTLSFASEFLDLYDPTTKVFFYNTNYPMMLIIDSAGYAMSLYIDDWNATFDGIWLTGSEQFDIQGAVYTIGYWVMSTCPPDGDDDISRKYV